MGNQWEDVGAAWDALVGGRKGGKGDSAAYWEDDEDGDFDSVDEGRGDGQGGKRVRITYVGGGDESEWAWGGEGTEFRLFGAVAAGMRNGHGPSVPLEEFGPLRELPDYLCGEVRDGAGRWWDRYVAFGLQRRCRGREQ